jgi:6-phosphogluconate dehydrogenase
MNEERSVGDMYFAAALVSYGATMVRIDKSDKKHQKFVFEDNTVSEIWVEAGNLHLRIVNPIIKEIEKQFFSKKLVYPPSYPDTIRSIKSAIHSV